MSKSDSEEKSLPPSAKKLREARKKGEIAKSREMVTAVATVAGFGVVAARASASADRFADILRAAGDATERPFWPALRALTGRLAVLGAEVLLPLLAILFAAIVLTNLVVNGGLVASADPVKPKLERLDPIQGVKRMFSLRNLIELLKNLAKLALVLAVTVALAEAAIPALVQLPACGLRCAPPVARALPGALLAASCVLFLAVGFLDIGLQRFLFRRDMRMTRTEAKRERKEMEGDPLIKRQHRREQRAATQSRARAGLRNATFVIRSADMAVAMRFRPPDAQVPILVARARAEAADALAEEARRLDLPLVFDPATAAAVAARLKVGSMIPKDMFNPVIACMRQAGVL